MPDDPNVSKTAKRYGAPRDPKRLRAELFEQAGRNPQKSRDAWEGIVLAEVGPAPDDARTRAGGRNSSSGSEVLEARGRLRCTEDDDHKEAGPLDLLAVDELPTPSKGFHGPSRPRGLDLARKQQLLEAVESKREPHRQIKPDPPRNLNPSGDAKSQANLLERGKLLLKRYKREEGLSLADTDLDPCLFVDWLTALRLFWKPSSWRLYKAAAFAVIERLPQNGRDEAIARLTGSGRIETKARRQYKQSRAKDPKLSKDRAELILAGDYRKLITRLRKTSCAPSLIEPLEDWLVAGLHTGVLPAEWPLVELEKGLDRQGRRHVWLHVANATATGVQRTLDISRYSDPTLSAIERMVNRSEQWAREGTTARHQSEVAKALDDICAEIFPDRRIRFSLFTVRHQFIANMKAVWRDEAVVSALIGQLIVKTGRAHYTKVRAAWSAEEIREVPVPPKRSVDRFQMLLAMYRERAELREAKAVRRALDAEDQR